MRKGVTVVEILVGIAILGVVLVLVTSALSLFRTTSGLSEAHATIISMLMDARARTLASEYNSAYGVHFDQTSRTVILFKGDVYSESDPANEVYSLPNGVIIQSPDSVDVVFTRLSGTTTPATITLGLSSDPTKSKMVGILSTGIAQ